MANYGMTQTYAYVDGCSGGGRQGFAEAQSFPTDYNGILAGAPSIAQTPDSSLRICILASFSTGTLAATTH
jgi:feruloyl esterase